MAGNKAAAHADAGCSINVALFPESRKSITTERNAGLEHMFIVMAFIARPDQAWITSYIC